VPILPTRDDSARAGSFDRPALEPIVPDMIDALSDAIVVVDRSRIVVAANRRYLEVFGTRGGAIAGASCANALQCPERDLLGPGSRCPACRAMEEKQVQREIRVIPGPDGAQRRWEATFNPILGPDGIATHVVEVWRDISDRGALEAQLAHSERLASVGMLAAGVGHEINNPLASMLAATESMQRLLDRKQFDPETCSEALELAQVLEREVLRARETTQKLMLLAQPVSSEKTYVDVNQAVADTASLLQFQMRRQQVAFGSDCDPGLPQPWARDSGVRGVCMNLMMNAVQAMESGGTLTARTAHRGSMVELVIEDSGPGIASEHLSRIWEPFFTTKPAGKGTGLGLFVTQGVVTRSGGSIRVENRAEGGARFIVQWPIDGTERQSS
jgi:PAS domain S-box-containing protein